MINSGIINVREVRELTIEEFIERVEDLFWYQGISDYRITEDFKLNGKLCYSVSRLKVETENEQVFCSDEKGIIQKGFCVMMSFLRECIVSIKEIYIENIPHAEIEFADGKVTIEILNAETKTHVNKPILTSLMLSHSLVGASVGSLIAM